MDPLVELHKYETLESYISDSHSGSNFGNQVCFREFLVIQKFQKYGFAFVFHVTYFITFR
jgi:hypothetical protein